MFKKQYLSFILIFAVIFSFTMVSCDSGGSGSDSGVQEFSGMTLEGLTNNGSTASRTAIVTAIVPNPNSSSTTTYNGVVRVYVNNAYVDAYPEYSGTAWIIYRSVSLNTGTNTIYVSIYSEGSEYARSNTFTVTGSFVQVPWRFELTWNTDENDVDLHLVKDDGWGDPNRHCYYYYDSIAEVATLDYDDTDGYGPENISIEPNAPAGTYRIYVKYFSADLVTGNVTATVRIFEDGTLIDTKTHVFSAADESDDDEIYNPAKDWFVYEVTL